MTDEPLPKTHPDCTCIQSRWSSDHTTILNTFEIDRECPVHGDASWDPKPNRWQWFTDDELDDICAPLLWAVESGQAGSDRDRLLGEISAEVERRRA